MSQRFEKKETDKSEIEKEEKKIGIGKIITGVAITLFSATVLIFTNGKHGDPTKS